MKKINIYQIILGLILILLSLFVAYSSTYAYEFVEGHKGREFITVMYGVIFTLSLICVGFYLAIRGADNGKL